MATLGNSNRNRVAGWLVDSDEIGPVRRKIQTFLMNLANTHETSPEPGHAFLGKFVLAAGVVLSLIIAVLSLNRPEAAAKAEADQPAVKRGDRQTGDNASNDSGQKMNQDIWKKIVIGAIIGALLGGVGAWIQETLPKYLGDKAR